MDKKLPETTNLCVAMMNIANDKSGGTNSRLT